MVRDGSDSFHLILFFSSTGTCSWPFIPFLSDEYHLNFTLEFIFNCQIKGVFSFTGNSLIRELLAKKKIETIVYKDV